MKRLIPILLALAVSCSVREAAEREVIPLHGERIELNTDPSLFEMVYIDDDIFVASTFSRTKLLTAIKLDGSGECQDFLDVGRGPLEVNGASFSSHGDTIHAMSYTPGGIDGVIAIPIGKISDKSSWKSRDLALDSNFMFGNGFDLISGSRYLVLGDAYGKENILSIVDADAENTCSPVGYFPEDDYDGEVIPKQGIYTRASKVFCNGNKALYVCGDGKYASILDLSAEGLDEIRIYDENPVYGQASDGINPFRSSKSKSGVYSFANDSLICLSPLTVALSEKGWESDNFKSYPPYFTDVVEIYDWHGKFLKAFMLDTPGCGYYITEDNGYLYELTVNPETKISELYKYRLGLD